MYNLFLNTSTRTTTRTTTTRRTSSSSSSSSSSPKIYSTWKPLLLSFRTAVSQPSSSSTTTTTTFSKKVVPNTINITEKINDWKDRQLYKQEGNSINQIKKLINEYFQSYHNNIFFTQELDSPIVTCQQAFDDLLIPLDHPTRKLTHTYYLNSHTILRPQTSAHQTAMIREGHRAFLVTGDCYRKSIIDPIHYPVFHQMEGVRIWPSSEITLREVEKDLKRTLDDLIDYLFISRQKQLQQQQQEQEQEQVSTQEQQYYTSIQKRWSEDYSFFTYPSLQMHVKMETNYWKILRAGIIHPKILENCKLKNHIGWSFGLGLDRLAMILYGMNDIRTIWGTNNINNNNNNNNMNQPKIQFYRDITFSFKNQDESKFHENDWMEMIREVTPNDLILQVKLTYAFQSRKTGREYWRTYRIFYQHPNNDVLTDNKVNEIHQSIIDNSVKQFNATIRTLKLL